MLKRKSIRTKLVVALTLLSAIVVVLAFSGFWGLHRYRQLARAVSQRASEFDLAHNLHLAAVRLRQSNEDLHRYDDQIGMIESSPLIDREENDYASYSFAWDDFSHILNRYLQQAAAWSEEDAVLIDSADRLIRLSEIDLALRELENAKRSIHAEDSRSLSRQLDSKHERLVDQTQANLTSIRESLERFSDVVRGQQSLWIIIACSCSILAVVMVGILVGAFHSLVVKPFRTLVDGSRLVASGQFDHRIDLGTGDELSELADAMNDMTDRFQKALAKVNSWATDLDRQVQERSKEVIQNEQLASVGFLAAGVAHEINNPLASIAWSAESLQSRAAELVMQPPDDRVLDDETSEALMTNLRRIEEEAYRCKGITEKLLDFSRLSEVKRAPTDLVELVSDVVSMVRTVGKYRCKTVRLHSGDTVVASVNPQEIRQVVLNLVTNALESIDCDDGAVDVYVGLGEKRATITVQDTGCGMSPDVLKHLFEPFFTRRRDGSGTGLGLSITYRIVSQHGGSLTAQSEGEGKGSRLEMRLPLSVQNDDDHHVRNSNGTSYEPYQAA